MSRCGFTLAAFSCVCLIVAQPTVAEISTASSRQTSTTAPSVVSAAQSVEGGSHNPVGNKTARSWPVLLDTQLMRLGMAPPRNSKPAPAAPSLTPPKITWTRRPDCLDHNLQIVIDELAERFGDVLVTSTCRTPEHNRRVGGVKRSQHIGGHAVDFYLIGNARKARTYLRAHRTVGGLGYYGNGRFHIDNGQRRNW